MQIKITTNAQAIEKVNYLLGQTLQVLMDKPDVAKSMDISGYDIHIMKTFRKQMLKSYFSWGKQQRKARKLK